MVPYRTVLFMQCFSSLLFLTDIYNAKPYQCESFQRVFPMCACNGKVDGNAINNNKLVIDCENINLSSIPNNEVDLQYIIYELILRNNAIITLKPSMFRGLRIVKLDLRNNLIRSIDDASFNGLETDLQQLYLGAAEGRDVQVNITAFSNLSTLTTLHLEYFTFPNNQLTLNGFDQITWLKSLTLKHNGLISLDPQCLPVSLSTLSLQHQRLSSMPLDMLRSLSNLRRLDITHTGVSEVGQKAFVQNTALETLDLSSNRIHHLHQLAFSGLAGRLLHLSLSDNPIGTIAALEPIQTLTELSKLILSKIGLSDLTEPIFLKNKQSLKILALDENDIGFLNSDMLSGVRNTLLTLNLSGNRLQHMDNKCFQGLSQLKLLDLSRQKTRTALSLPSSISELTCLQSLLLSNSPLVQDTLWTHVTTLTSLHTLHVDNTSINTIENFALRNLTQLTVLNMHGNELTEITQQMMAGTWGLRQLTLSHNWIQKISKCTFHGFDLSSTLNLDLQGNPLLCDCHLDWLLGAVERNVTLSGNETCTQPADKMNIALSEFSEGDFTCAQVKDGDVCADMYADTTAITSSTYQGFILSLNISSVSMTGINITWTLGNYSDLLYFRVQHTNLESSAVTMTNKINKDARSYRINRLNSGSTYSVCVFAYIQSVSEAHRCQVTTTLTTSGEDETGKTVLEAGVIAGVVVGIVLLMVIFAILLYLILTRKKDECKKASTTSSSSSSHTFHRCEPMHPTATNQTTSPNTNQTPKIGRAMDMSCISDGRTPLPMLSSRRQYVNGYGQILNTRTDVQKCLTPEKEISLEEEVRWQPLPSTDSLVITQTNFT